MATFPEARSREEGCEFSAMLFEGVEGRRRVGAGPEWSFSGGA